MVNQVILDYLIQNYGKYPLESLKTKILSSGYAKNDFDETLAFFLQKKETPKVNESSPRKPIKIKWMKIAAIIGLVFTFLLVVQFVISMFIKINLPPMVGTIILILVTLATFIVLYGFVKMGDKTSKLLKFSSWAFIAGIILLIIALFTLYFYATTFIASATNITTVADITTSTNSIPLWEIILIFACIAIYLTIIILFQVGLIIAGKTIRFAKLAGILGIIQIGLILVLVSYIIINPLSLFGLLFSSSARLVLTLVNVFFSLLAALIYLLYSLSLFDASKKFE